MRGHGVVVSNCWVFSDDVSRRKPSVVDDFWRAQSFAHAGAIRDLRVFRVVPLCSSSKIGFRRHFLKNSQKQTKTNEISWTLSLPHFPEAPRRIPKVPRRVPRRSPKDPEGSPKGSPEEPEGSRRFPENSAKQASNKKIRPKTRFGCISAFFGRFFFFARPCCHVCQSGSFALPPIQHCCNGACSIHSGCVDPAQRLQCNVMSLFNPDVLKHASDGRPKNCQAPHPVARQRHISEHAWSKNTSLHLHRNHVGGLD